MLSCILVSYKKFTCVETKLYGLTFQLVLNWVKTGVRDGITSAGVILLHEIHA